MNYFDTEFKFTIIKTLKMKKRILQYGVVCTILITIVSFKSKEKEDADEKTASVESNIDSLENFITSDAEANGDRISTDFDRKKQESNDAISNLGHHVKASNQARLNSINNKYIVVKTSVEATKFSAKPNTNQELRNKFFGVYKIGDDINFSWVNRDTILHTYQDDFLDNKSKKELTINFKNKNVIENVNPISSSRKSGISCIFLLLLPFLFSNFSSAQITIEGNTNDCGVLLANPEDIKVNIIYPVDNLMIYRRVLQRHGQF